MVGVWVGCQKVFLCGFIRKSMLKYLLYFVKSILKTIVKWYLNMENNIEIVKLFK